MPYDGRLDAREEGVLCIEVGMEVGCDGFVRKRKVVGSGGRLGGRRRFESRETSPPPIDTEINPLLRHVVYTSDDVFDPFVLALEQAFERVEVERRDVVGLEPDEEVDLRGVETFKPMRFGEVGEEGVFQVLRGQVLLRGEISKRKPCTAWLPG